MKTVADVNHNFTPVEKLEVAQQARVRKLIVETKEFATTLIDLCPEGEHREAALAKLLEAKFLATQSITHQKAAQNVKANKED